MTNYQQLQCSFLPPPIEYTIQIGKSLLKDGLAFAATLSTEVVVVTTSALYPDLPEIENPIILPSHESIKSRAMRDKLEEILVQRHFSKEGVLIAIGGGSLLDLVGFVASTYCRGVKYVTFPTTLLSMTDGAIGGKTAINTFQAKNWIGSFHHPTKVYIDLNFFETLPERERIAGLAETVKHGLIADSDLVTFLEEHHQEVILGDRESLALLIAKSIAVKIGVVERDPYEKEGLRQILNFGHTVGHALEAFSRYTLRHGEAVVMGMLVEGAMAYVAGQLPFDAYHRLRHLIALFPFQHAFPSQLPFELMRFDKKNRGWEPHYVQLEEIGSVYHEGNRYTFPISQPLFKEGWELASRFSEPAHT